MELRQYGKILGRRLWIVILFTLGTAMASLLLTPQAQPSYLVSMRLLVSVPTEPRTGEYFGYNRVYAFQAAEYLIDDLSELLKSQRFAADLRADLNSDSVDLGNIETSRREKTHRILSYTVSHSDPEMARRVAESVKRVVESKAHQYFGQLEYGDARVELIDPPEVNRQEGSFRNYLELVLRTILGALAGISVAFLLHYLDTKLYDADEAQRFLELSVLGEIPVEIPSVLWFRLRKASTL